MPSSEAPANNWNSCEDEVFVWHFDLPAIHDVLVPWQRSILEAGERTGILRVQELTLMDGYFRHDRDGYILDFLVAHPNQIPNIEPEDSRSQGIFTKYLDSSFGALPATRLEYYGRDGGIIDTWVSDMSEIGSAAGLPEWFHQPPVMLGGMDSLPGEDAPVSFELAVTADIFFPWNPAIRRPGFKPLDNTHLAHLNGSRLNAFLSALRAATLTAGGEWKPVPNYSRNRRQVDENGFILLDAPSSSWQIGSQAR
ncbi:hypothetical protein GFY24_36180 [Nocardia sp. SYP-A9097]|uniref:hypothetical protein n=1 Tax=Nocardia sp. SYP-A9097 TaxID=2663237 RepID=UPI00129BA3C1|nr:hypothetical protein [Nocardia sp. SYP-A9097]MRH92797.1 hypothetical protein [Nocardia sp. SYP-A9097]